MTSNEWSETFGVLSAFCTQKTHIHTKATEGEENLCLFCYNDDKLPPADRFHSSFISFVASCASGRFFGRWLALGVFRGCGGRGVNPGSRVENEA